MGKISTNLIVAVFAFLIGIASALAFNKINAVDQTHIVPSVYSDPMGNVRASQD